MQFRFQFDDPFRQPAHRVFGGLKLHIDLVLDVERGQSIGDAGGFQRVGGRGADVENIGVALVGGGNGAADRPHGADHLALFGGDGIIGGRSGVCGRGIITAAQQRLQPGHGRGRAQGAVEFGIAGQVELGHQLLQQPAGADDLQFGIDRGGFGGHARHDAFEIDHRFLAQLQGQTAGRGVFRHRHPIGIPGPDRQREKGGGENHPFAPPEAAGQFQQVDFVTLLGLWHGGGGGQLGHGAHRGLHVFDQGLLRICRQGRQRDARQFRCLGRSQP